MNKIKTIGVIGMGSVGISISCMLQQAGLNVVGFKKKGRETEVFKNLIKNRKINVINNTGNKHFSKKMSLNATITSSLQEIVETSDLILNCSLFPQVKNLYHFNMRQKKVIAKNNIPVLAFPGKLGATWLIGKGEIQVGLVGYSPVFATKEIDLSNQEIIVKLKDFKSKIPLAYDHENTRLQLLDFLNKHLVFKKDTPTFIDGGSVLKTALSSPISAINASAICDNTKKLVQSSGKTIKAPIYALSKKYSQLFQNVFNEQVMVANALQFSNLPTIKDWLRNRPHKIQSDNVTMMLEEIYGSKYIKFDTNDRRITESFYALLFFKYFSERLGHSVPATNTLLSKLEALHKKLNKKYSLLNTTLYIQKSATLFAESILNKRQLYNYSPFEKVAIL